MNKFIKDIIEETFKSKAQQRYFYAQASKGGKKGKKWSKWAKEFSNKTDFDKIPDKVENEEVEVDEIVDKKGNIGRSKKPTNFNSKGITQNKTTDEVVKSGAGSMGIHGVHGTHTSLRYWAENVELTKKDLIEMELDGALGAEDTILQNVPYDKAKEHMEDDLGLDEPEAEERLEKMGYDKNLPEDKVRLVEDPKKFMEEYIESIVSKKRQKDNDILSKEGEVKEVHPIIKRQIHSLKQSMGSHGLSVDDIVKHLKSDNE